MSNPPPFTSAWRKRALELNEQGRRLASEREDLIAAGVDPTVLLVPLAPDFLCGVGGCAFLPHETGSHTNG